VEARKSIPYDDNDGHEYDEQGVSLTWNRIHDEMYDVVDKILEYSPRSLADLGIQLQAFALAESATLLFGDGMVNSDRLVALMDAACKLCDVEDLPGTDYLVKAYS
jgi:hypothetical protein